MADTRGTEGRSAFVRVWDPVVRVFHWSAVTLYAAAYLFEDPRDLHKFLGYALMVALAVRLVWGLAGTKHARFSDFVAGPLTVARYLRDMVLRRERRHLGHNPAGGAMILALMLVLAGIGTTGYMMGMDRFFGESWVEDWHVRLTNLSLLLIVVHVAGVVHASLHHRENLVASMVTGYKRPRS